MRRRRTLVALLIGVSLLSISPTGAGAAADAQEHRVTTVQFRFVPDLLMLPKGDSLVYTNVDFVDHNVVSERLGPDGKPLFESVLVAPGESRPVTGVDRLRLGTYAFYCAPHPWMIGKLRVVKT